MKIAENMQKKCNIDKNELYSFDIFDTLITRTTANPVGIFSIMQYKIQQGCDSRFNALPDFVKNNFTDIRFGADYYARRNNMCINEIQDITIQDAYKIFKYNYNISDDLINLLIELELETEEKNLYPIRKNINKLKDLYNEGKKVILISDMYLPSKFLRKILVSFDKVFENIDIFVSNEYRVLKYTGDLYKLIKEKYNVEYKNWYHFGDNKHADFKVPIQLGINAEKYNYSTLTSWESDYFTHTNYDIKGQVCFGLAKLCKEMSNNKSEAYKFATSFGAPVLYSYVNWLLDIAVNEEIKDLFFMARDGYVLQQIADIIIEKKNLPINTHYFYGSRLSLRFPNEESYETYINSMLYEFSYFKSLKYVSERLNLGLDVILKFAPELSKISLNKKLSISDVKYLIEVISTNNALKTLIIKKSKEKENILKKYINQEINFENKFAFVDVTGTGMTQDILYSIMGENRPELFTMFYLATDSAAVKDNPNTKKRAYMHTGLFCPYVFEFVCRCSQGQTLGYKEQNGKIVPIKEFEQFDAILNWGFDSYLLGIKDYVKLILDFEEKNDIHISFANIIRYWHRMILTYSNYDLAKIMAKIPQAKNGKEVGKDIYLRKYSLLDAIFITDKTLELYWVIRLAISSKLVKMIFDFKRSKLSLIQYIKEKLFK